MHLAGTEKLDIRCSFLLYWHCVFIQDVFTLPFIMWTMHQFAAVSASFSELTGT